MDTLINLVPKAFENPDGTTYNVKYLTARLSIEKEVNLQTGFTGVIILNFLDENKQLRGQKRLTRDELTAFCKAQNDALTDDAAGKAADKMIIELINCTAAKQKATLTTLAGYFNYEVEA